MVKLNIKNFLYSFVFLQAMAYTASGAAQDQTEEKGKVKTAEARPDEKPSEKRWSRLEHYSGILARLRPPTNDPKSAESLAAQIAPMKLAPTEGDPALKARHAFLNTPYTRVSFFDNPFGVDLGNGRTAQYNLNFPQAPMIHTYHPTDNNEPVPIVLINVKFPTESFKEKLPQNLIDHIESKKLSTVDIFWIVQNNPWTTQRILLRPHYYLNPHAPYKGREERSFNVQAALLDADYGISLAESNFSICTHPDGKEIIVSSPDNAALISTGQTDASYSFWSSVESGGQMAITLHWVLKHFDFHGLKKNSTASSTLQEILTHLNTSDAWKDFPGWQKLKGLCGI